MQLNWGPLARTSFHGLLFRKGTCGRFVERWIKSNVRLPTVLPNEHQFAGSGEIADVSSYGPSKIDKRAKEILRLLLRHGKTSVDDLTGLLKMSPASVRR